MKLKLKIKLYFTTVHKETVPLSVNEINTYPSVRLVTILRPVSRVTGSDVL